MADETKAAEKPAKTELLEVVLERDYWPHGVIEAVRGEDIVTVDIGIASPEFGFDNRLRKGDIVKLPKKEAAKIINAGAAKMPEIVE